MSKKEPPQRRHLHVHPKNYKTITDGKPKDESFSKFVVKSAVEKVGGTFYQETN